ncbi:SDR family NAD(P)-dependent oxidoreductase [Mycobacterium sp.]|uniref:SDR family NAD(P)-dependent oxidoreductase n=1 Tax=Mycobacterium sp. TaxID=1785 RepID=UPI003BAAF6DD
MQSGLLERYCSSELLRVFHELGVFHRPGEQYELAELSARLGIISDYRRLFPALLRILERAAYLQLDNSRVQTTSSVGSSSLAPTEIASLYRNLVESQPEFAAHAEVLRDCLAAYPEVLTGRRNAIEVLFPRGSLSRLEAIYKRDVAAHACGNLTADLVSSYVVANQDSRSTIRILEAGAGTGATSALVLPALAKTDASIEFVYTDISPAFLEHGRRSFEIEYPFVRFERLDLEAAPAEQEFSPGEIDLVFACNVLHATRDIAETLAHVKWLLRPQGVIAITEVTQAHDFATLLFGLTGGWWRFEDEGIRIPDSPLLTPSSWKQVISEAGFGGIEDLTPIDGQWSVLVAESDTDVAKDGDGGVAPAETERPAAPVVPLAATGTPLGVPSQEGVMEVIRAAFSDVLRIPPARIRPDVKFEKFGVDSLVALELNKRLERRFGSLPASLLFEHDTAAKLGAYLSSLVPGKGIPGSASSSSAVHAGRQTATATATVGPETSSAAADVTHPEVARLGAPRATSRSGQAGEPIAIVGVAGRFPQADSPSEFWTNLRSGTNCVRQFPEDRLALLPSHQRGEWYGGFLEDIDKFDPTFFGIAPLEAEYMDPQERLWIQTAWHAMEDAGYTRARFERLEDLGRPAGVFVGCMYSQYTLATSDPQAAGRLGAGGHWSIANRTSYLLHLRGPSIAIDTACSSSLTAIHLACQSIRRGECGAAIAGGVNLTIHPGKYEALKGAALLADGSQSSAFGQSAGLLPGEAVGAVVLRPFRDAIADNDFIYGVVLGSAANHGGKTGGYRIPNPEAQAELIRNSLHQAGIAPESISYIEAAANGSPLGDPLEFVGLRQAFGALEARIGSVKSNIGHSESASGIAQLTKVLGQFREGQIFPTIHSEPRNPHLGIENTGLRLVTSLEPWSPDGARRAAISSFGAGGANAHLIVEEYRVAKPDVNDEGTVGTPELVVLSAATEEQLRQQCERLLAAVSTEPPSLADLAYTLQTGREHLAERLAVTVTSTEELQSVLGAFLQHEPRTVVRGCSEEDSDLKEALGGAAGEGYLKILRDDRDWIRAASLWVRGIEIDWAEWHSGRAVRRFPLPGYPFAKRRCWVEAGASQTAPMLHPLVHQQIIRDGLITFVTYFNGSEPFLAQHRLAGKATMPAAGLLEMARAAAQLTRNAPPTRLSRLAWTTPLQVTSARQGRVEIEFVENANDDLDFRILGVDSEIASGTAHFTEIDGGDALRPGVCGATTYDPDELYAVFEQAGLELGPHFRSLESMQLSMAQAQATLALRESHAGYGWQPGLLDGVLQTLAGLRACDGEPSLQVPYWIDSVTVHGDLGERAEVVVAPAAGCEGSVDISVWNEKGELALALRGVATRSYPGPEHVLQAEPDDMETLLARLAGDVLKLAPEEVPRTRAFPDFGFDSASLVAYARSIGERFGIELSPAELFARPTIAELATQLKAKQVSLPKINGTGEARGTAGLQQSLAQHKSQVPGQRAMVRRTGTTAPIDRNDAAEPIAIVGMACQFPGSADAEEFWRHLEASDDLIGEVPSERWNWRDFGTETPARWGGFLDRVDLFDPLFFGISPREASLMDPQHRLFLETVWHTIENAGYAPSELAGSSTELFVGVSTSDYADLIRASVSGVESQMATGIAHSILANRISYLLDLRGVSQPVDTACSSSLVAIHHAVEAIRQGRCDLALAGGVNVILSPVLAMGFGKAGFMSPSGRCSAFGDKADGYVRGEGVGAVLLKPLSRAVADADHIHAVIRGVAVNHGGRSASLPAPNARAQSALLTEAWRQAGVGAASIGYIEAHGTGTALGDPIEVLGIKEALEGAGRSGRDGTMPCWLGSVKSNLGHLEAAAGMAGVIKTVLALQRRTIPPTLHAEVLNRHLPLKDTPINIAQHSVDWPHVPGLPRRGGVSSFGFGGTNAHVVLEEAPLRVPSPARPNAANLAVLSARTPDCLREYARVLATFFESHQQLSVDDVCYTLRVGRVQMGQRWSARVKSLTELTERLRSLAVHDLQSGTHSEPGHRHAATDTLPDVLPGQRIPLPMYPFARKSHWFKPIQFEPIQASEHEPRSGRVVLDPSEPRIADHRVGDQLVCAGAIIVDEALRVAARGKRVRLSEWTWLRPVVLAGSDTVELRVRCQSDDVVVETEDGVAVAKGLLAEAYSLDEDIVPPQMDAVVSGENLYEIFEAEGVSYGTWFRLITALTEADGQVWARFCIPPLDQTTPRADLLDAAMQCASYLCLRRSERGLPYGLTNLEWSERALPSSGWIQAAIGDVGLTFKVADETGRVFLRLVSLVFQEPPAVSTLSQSTLEWCEEKDNSPMQPDSRWLIVAETADADFAKTVALGLPNGRHQTPDEVELSSPPEAVCYVAPTDAGLAASVKGLGFLQSLSRKAGPDSALPLTVVTRGEQKITGEDEPHPDQAGVCGLAVAAARENFGWTVRTIDVAANVTTEELVSVLKQGDSSDSGSRLAYRSARRYVRRLIDRGVEYQGDAWRERGVYLITGPYGGIGSSLARHLALTCKARLALISRREPGPTELRSIEKLEELGAEVLPIAVDLADADACHRAVNSACTRFGEINGVFHSALVLEDRMLAEVTSDSLERVCRPKYQATLNLCGEFRDRAIDFLCVFSSIASIAGSFGQGSYVAASALQDAVALSAGEGLRLPVRVINWGYWEHGGSGERNSELMERMGIDAIRPGEAFAWLRRFLAAGDDKQLVVTRKSSEELRPASPRLKSTLSPEVARRRISEIISRLLHISADELDPDTPLESYGLDSIVTLQFSDVLTADFGRVTPAEIAENRTINALGALVSGGKDAVARVSPPRELLVFASEGCKPGAPVSYWVHGAPGYAQVFQPLSTDPTFPVYAFQARGIDGVTPPFDDFDAMADYYCECMDRMTPGRSAIIGGYSLGGVVALEVARRWHQAGNPVKLLVLLDTYPNAAPVERLFSSLRDQGFYQIMLANMFLATRGYESIPIAEADLEAVPAASRLAALARIVSERNNGVPAEHDVYRALLGTTAVSNATGEAFRRFHIAPYDASDVLFIRAARGFVLAEEGPFSGMVARFGDYDYLAAWREIIRSPLTVETVDADHFSLLSPDNAGQVRSMIEKATISAEQRAV